MSDLNQANSPATAAPVVKTKEEKLASITAQIAKLQQRYDDVLNDRVTAKVAKVAYCPVAGDRVLATVGRNTPTSQARVVEGTVVAVRVAPIVDGKAVGSTQVRVRINEGEFDEQLVTLYPANLTPVPTESTDDVLNGASDEGSVEE